MWQAAASLDSQAVASIDDPPCTHYSSTKCIFFADHPFLRFKFQLQLSHQGEKKYRFAKLIKNTKLYKVFLIGKHLKGLAKRIACNFVIHNALP